MSSEPRAPREPKEGRERSEKDRERRHREGKDRERSERTRPAPPAAEDQEAFLDSIIADCNDKPPARGLDVSPAQRDMPKRPSSRADSRPKEEGVSRPSRPSRPPEEVERPEAPSGPSPERTRPRRAEGERREPKEKKERSEKDRGERAARGERERREKPREEAGAIPRAPEAPPDRSSKPRRSHKEAPAAPPVTEEQVVPAAPPPAPTATHKPKVRSSRPAVEAPRVEEEQIEVHVPIPSPHHQDDMDDVEYDEDFEEADEEEEYIPQVMLSSSPSPPTPSRDDSSVNKVTFRPVSSHSSRAPTPPSGKETAAAADIKRALQSENEQILRKSNLPTSPDVNRTKRGLLAEYESTMPKFNLTGGVATSPAQRAALNRLKDLKELKVINRLGVEVGSLFQQKPQQDIQLFLAGKSLKYCKLKTTSCQTGDDDIEIGINTEEIWTDEKEMQFPTLTGQTAKTTGAEAQLLPFLRRVLPLFEASMMEINRRDGIVPPPPDETLGQTLVRCTLPETFVSTFLGAPTAVQDLTLVPQWYGADHALALYTWPEAPRPPVESGSSLTSFLRPLRSLVGLHPLMLGGSSVSSRPARCLYSFCQLTSLAVVNGRPHLIVAGSETGSLLVYDLRARARSPAELLGDMEGLPPNPDPDIDHFQGAVWLPSAFSTDVFVLPSGLKGLDDDMMSMGSLGFSNGLGEAEGHSNEICCVRSSDAGAASDALIFAMDLSGVVSFWRVLELAGAGVKLALQGSISLAESHSRSHVLGDFVNASYLCIHPQQQAQFIALSQMGIHQAQRQGHIWGPKKLDLQEDAEPFSQCSQPTSASFNPFFPNLLVVAYAEGDLALFDCSLCVPVTHWACAVNQAPQARISVAWSTRRPCVFFVKCGDVLDVWDLSEQTHAPVQSISVQGDAPRPPGSLVVNTMPCSELMVGQDGRPMVSLGSSVVLLGLPSNYTTPLQSLPPRYGGGQDQTIDELLLPGYEKDQVFPTLARHIRNVEISPLFMLERDVLRRVVCGINPMQAWVGGAE